MSEQLKLLSKEKIDLQNLLFEAYLLHLEQCEDVVPSADIQLMNGYDAWVETLKKRAGISKSSIRLDGIRKLKIDLETNKSSNSSN